MLRRNTIAVALAACVCSTSVQAAVAPGDAQIVGAGDIAESGGKQLQTSNLILNIGGKVFTLGDNAYPSGRSTDFAAYYQPTWGRSAIKSRTFPTPGNHDYETAGAAGYYRYFGSVAAQSTCGFHVHSLGSFWVGIFMNSETCISAQTTRLRAALVSARNARKNVITFWHKPRHAIGTKGSVSSLQAWWNLMDEFDVDINLVGHEHFYSRQNKIGADGLQKTSGTRWFVAGTGGAHLRGCGNLRPETQRCISQHGVLILLLRQVGYGWSFRGLSGATLDSGSDSVVGIHP